MGWLRHCEAAVRKICANRAVIHQRSALMSEDTHKKVSTSVRRLIKPNGEVYLWINSLHWANCSFHLHSPFWKQAKLLNNYIKSRTLAP